MWPHLLLEMLHKVAVFDVTVVARPCDIEQIGAHFRDVKVTGDFDRRHDLCLDVRPIAGLAGEFVSSDHHCADNGAPGLGAPAAHRLTAAPGRELGLEA
jgi:hypothetical protein